MKKLNKVVAWVMGTALVLLFVYNIYMHFDILALELHTLIFEVALTM